MVKMIQNLHTHGIYCDGRDTPSEMAERAIALGFTSLGFSSHANTVFGDSCELLDMTEAYISEIRALKEKYRGTLTIYLGTELDRYSEGCVDERLYDYTIASTHYGIKDGEKISYDISLEHSRDVFARLFNSDPLEYARLYYETLADMPNHIGGDFVGHFDLLTKFDRVAPELFDTGAPEYRKMALEALHAVREKYEFFEINTGALGRGWRPEPYPAPFILDEMRALGCRMIVTTDCHNRLYLDSGFDGAVQLLRAHGFGEIYNLTERGFEGTKI